jgi:hypothetical protein
LTNIYFHRLVKKPSVYIAIAGIIIYQIFQLFTMDIVEKDAGIAGYYTVLIHMSFLSIFAPFIYCVFICGKGTFLSDINMIIRSGGRLRLSADLLEFSFFDSLIFTLIVNIIPFFYFYTNCGFCKSSNLYYISSFLQLVMYFIVCSLLYGVVQMFSGKAYMGVIAVIFYGALDFVLLRIYPQWRYATAGRAFMQNISETADNVRVLAAEIIILTVMLVAGVLRIDFLTKAEKNK